jgi:zinc D-Ala-D-Ala carboxypeptidase
MTKLIERNRKNKTTNSVEGNLAQHPYSVQDDVVPGSRYLNEAIKLLNEKNYSKIIENATVLEVIAPPDNPDGKTKYILPHLNLEDGKTFEGYLCKIRLPEDIGSLPDPQDMFGDDKDSIKKLFEPQTKSVSEKINIINYYHAVANHKTFAPIDPENTKRPAPNSKVRVRCFSGPHMYSGGTIDGFYEIIDSKDDMFESGLINDILADYRKYIEDKKKIIETTTNNISNFISSVVDSFQQTNPNDLEHEDERGQQDSMSLADGEMLSENFSLSQMIVAKRFPNIDNTPTDQHKENLRLLANNVLEPIRNRFGELIITSAYRSPEINERVGGAKTGDHPRGMAADIVPVSGTKNLLEVANWIKDNLSYKQLILEMWRPEANRGWIHVSFDINNNKKQPFEMYKDENGQTKSRPLKKA